MGRFRGVVTYGCGVRFLFLMFGMVSVVVGQGRSDFWDMEPIRYSDTVATDRLADLAGKMSKGEMKVEGKTGLERLRFVLKWLEVPEDSQVLVFSKTSLQNRLIEFGNPRSIYFSENAYVGYVPGGAIEVIVQDAVLGPVFYLVDRGGEGEWRVERDTNACMTCHATARTEGVPGMLVRSVFPGEDGQTMLHLGTEDVMHETAIEKRWGGWFVTGKSALPHLGNRLFREDGDMKPRVWELESVAEYVDESAYLRETSDVVALLVLEHQVKMHTLLNAAAMNFRRSAHFLKVLDAEFDPMDGSTGRMAEGWADEIVGCLFFKDEADLGEGVEGDAGFQREFLKRYPVSKGGDSLAEFRLYGRIFKNRCSYMVYSDAFRGLPVEMKGLVLRRMKDVIAGKVEGYEWLKESERKRIDEILGDTLEGWREG